MAFIEGILAAIKAAAQAMQAMHAHPVSPSRVYPAYDPSPLVPGEHYARLWLAEVQRRRSAQNLPAERRAPQSDEEQRHRVPQPSEYVFSSVVRFKYGDK
jgi:hypothetical protein